MTRLCMCDNVYGKTITMILKDIFINIILPDLPIIRTILLLLLLLSGYALAATSDLTKYVSVGNKFLDYMSVCEMREEDTGPLRIHCLNLCNANPGCKLACYKPNSCKIYSSQIEYYWQGAPDDKVNPDLVEHECFTSVFDHFGEIGHLATATARSTHRESDYRASFINDGSICPLHNKNYIHTVLSQSAWLQLDFQDKYKINQVQIQSRYFNTMGFVNANFYIGDTPNGGDMTENTHVLNFKAPGSAELGTLFKFDFGGAEGQYLIMTDTYPIHFIEIWIYGDKVN